MKTSTKILFGGLGLILLCGVLLAGITRATSTVYTAEECSKLPAIKKDLNFTFESISASQYIDVVLRQGDFEVSMECAEKLEPYLNHYVEDGILKLYVEDGADISCRVKFTIQCPTLNKISVSNGASVISDEVFDSPSLNLQIQNGALMIMDLRSDKVKVNAANGANVTLTGDIKSLNVEGANSSNITTKDAAVDITAIKLSNSAAATIHTDTITKANLTNSSLLRYVGTTQIENVNTNNSSSIERVEE
jgi:hypothetical protein